MVLQVDQEGHKALSLLADTYLKQHGLQGKPFIDALTKAIKVLPEQPSLDFKEELNAKTPSSVTKK